MTGIIVSPWWRWVIIIQDSGTMRPRQSWRLWTLGTSWCSYDHVMTHHGCLMIITTPSWLIMRSHDHLMTSTTPMHSLLFHMHMFNTWTAMYPIHTFPLCFSSFIYSSSFYFTPLPHSSIINSFLISLSLCSPFVWYLCMLVDTVIYKEVSQDWFLSLDLWPVNCSAALPLTGSLDWGIVRTNTVRDKIVPMLSTFWMISV